MTRELVVPDEAERAALAPIEGQAFGFPIDEAPAWFERAGHQNLRVVRDRGVVQGGLLSVPMGQWFGGRSVRMEGVAGVAVAPDARGSGLATWMMQEFLRASRAKGYALSTLYPATVPLYRRAGYERAGARHRITVQADRLVTGERGLAVRTLPADDAAAMALQSRFAAQRDGFLDRGAYLWSRVFHGRKGAHHHGLGVFGDHGLEGYVVYEHKQADGHDTAVSVIDLGAETVRAVRRILQLLADHRSLAGNVRWHGASPDVFTMALPDRRHEIEATQHWMLRIVDLPAALAARGYPPSLRAELALAVEDDVLPENAGRWLLRIEGGKARVERGGDGALALDVRALAALYTGYLPVSALALLGTLAGSEGARALAAEVFPQGNPCISEMF